MDKRASSRTLSRCGFSQEKGMRGQFKEKHLEPKQDERYESAEIGAIAGKRFSAAKSQ